MKIDDIRRLVDKVSEEMKGRWEFYRHRVDLKRRGWTEEQYQNYNDPDRNLRASRIKDYYHGYPYIVVFTTSRGDPWTRYPSWIEAYKAIEEWCKENCQGKWRTEIHRVIQDYWGNWEMNDVGGGDALFFAFKDVNDAFMFKLKWGGG